MKNGGNTRRHAFKTDGEHFTCAISHAAVIKGLLDILCINDAPVWHAPMPQDERQQTLVINDDWADKFCCFKW